ncbi:putative cytochrome P450 6a13 [Amphibalanus amphitrite]|uniref:Putative cytochrome P450 6a13 n=1 Tax=Amphibalanus amphitrite TaxID=1232801 RepID=A0A6A4W5Q6_AMPAM|nr:putative cytochrome P450 6a13 [Amphibalanus amphitrite]
MELHKPVLYVGDLDMISDITVKDFDYFVDKRNRTFSPVFARMLPFLQGREWREKRAEISPTFSSGKLKTMLPLFLRTADNLSRFLGEEMTTTSAGAVNMKDAFGRYTMDNIASCSFGIDSNSFENRNTELTRQASAFFKKPGVYGKFRALCILFLPKWISGLLPDPYAEVKSFFSQVTEATIRNREATEATRHDFLQLLLETRNKSGRRCFSTDDIVTQSLLFFLAGYDTTANLLTFAACALATVPDCQERVHRELDATLDCHGGRLSYEAVSELCYLDRVLDETLRMYPSLFHMERICTRPYTLPGTDVTIPAGTIVQLPLLPVHRDARVYPEPLRFNPDRFLPEERQRRHPGAYRPFGAGPRGCLARRFALLEAKAALAAVLRDWRLEPGPGTTPPPLPLDTNTTIVSPRPDCCFLRVVSRHRQ